MLQHNKRLDRTESDRLKPSSNFSKSSKVMICHDYIRNICPHQDSKSCKYNHPRVEVLKKILQNAMLNSDVKTATEIQKKIDKITGKSSIYLYFFW